MHVTLYVASSEQVNPSSDRRMRARFNWVVTAHEAEIEVLEEFRERAEGGSQAGALDSPAFLAAAVEWVVTSYFRAFEAIEEELEELDSRVMSDIPKNVSEDLSRLVELRRSIGTLRRASLHTVRSLSLWLTPSSMCCRPRLRQRGLIPSRAAWPRQWMLRGSEGVDSRLVTCSSPDSVSGQTTS